MDPTLKACDCGQISWMLNDPTSGLHLHNEDSFRLETLGGWSYMIYHCTSCGGKLPDSSKRIWYPRMTAREHLHLMQQCDGLETADDVIAKLGPPDYDALMMTYYPTADPDEWVLDEEKSGRTRNIEYYGLSENVNIEFYCTEGQPPRIEINLKYLPPRHIDAG